MLSKFYGVWDILVEYNGKAMSYYDATQKQRGMERDIRAIKRDLIGADTGMKNAPEESLKNAFKQDFDDASVKLKKQEAELQKFLHETGLDRQREREQVRGFGRSQAGKAVWVNKKAVDKYAGYRYNKDGTIIATDDRTEEAHPKILPNYKPYAVVDTASRNGKQRDRTIYDANAKMVKQIHGGDHGHPKQHPFGTHGEHVHDVFWDKSGKSRRPSRELTEGERRENADILKGDDHGDS